MLVFTQDYILQNEKVLLRPLMESDFELLLPYSENEPEIWQYNAFGANGAENLKKYIHTALENKKLQLEYPFAVIDKKQANSLVAQGIMPLIRITIIWKLDLLGTEKNTKEAM